MAAVFLGTWPNVKYGRGRPRADPASRLDTRHEENEKRETPGETPQRAVRNTWESTRRPEARHRKRDSTRRAAPADQEA